MLAQNAVASFLPAAAPRSLPREAWQHPLGLSLRGAAVGAVTAGGCRWGCHCGGLPLGAVIGGGCCWGCHWGCHWRGCRWGLPLGLSLGGLPLLSLAGLPLLRGCHCWGLSLRGPAVWGLCLGQDTAKHAAWEGCLWRRWARTRRRQRQP